MKTVFTLLWMLTAVAVTACQPMASSIPSSTPPLEPAELEEAMEEPWQAVSTGPVMAERLDSLCSSHIDAAGMAIDPIHVLRDVRGGGLALKVIVAELSWAYCVVELDRGNLDVREVGEVRSPPIVTGGDAVGSVNQGGADSLMGQMRFAFGVADESLESVDVVLSDGSIVTTSVTNGWWAAWWPTDLEARDAVPG